MSDVVFYGIKAPDPDALSNFPADPLWIGRAWAVTATGESLDGKWALPAARLKDGLDLRRSWVWAIGLQDVVDLPDLATALLIGCATHGHYLTAWEAGVIRRDIDAVRRERARAALAADRRRAENARAVEEMERKAAERAAMDAGWMERQEERRRKAEEARAAAAARKAERKAGRAA